MVINFSGSLRQRMLSAGAGFVCAGKKHQQIAQGKESHK